MNTKQTICLRLVLLAIVIIKPSDKNGFTADWQNIINDIKKDLEPVILNKEVKR